MRAVSANRRAVREALAEEGWRFAIVGSSHELKHHRRSLPDTWSSRRPRIGQPFQNCSGETVAPASLGSSRTGVCTLAELDETRDAADLVLGVIFDIDESEKAALDHAEGLGQATKKKPQL
jgi:hypothetical protein